MPCRPPRFPRSLAANLLNLALAILALVILMSLGHGPALAKEPVPTPKPLATQAPTPEPGPPSISARAAVVLDFATGDILYAKEPDLVIPPASLTKMMTLHLAWLAVESGRTSLDSLVDVPDQAWAAKLPQKASKMFLEPGQRVTLLEVMQGAAIPSGNDAAIALAIHLAGSVPAFAEQMNAEATRMGLTVLRFNEPAGLSPQNAITAREFALFCREYVRMHPRALDLLHSKLEFTYPKAKNAAPGRVTEPITQANRNRFLTEYPGTDGLKTGHISKSGYSVALSVKRGERRLIAVILGAPGKTRSEGDRNLLRDGKAVLDYCFGLP